MLCISWLQFGLDKASLCISTDSRLRSRYLAALSSLKVSAVCFVNRQIQSKLRYHNRIDLSAVTEGGRDVVLAHELSFTDHCTNIE